MSIGVTKNTKDTKTLFNQVKTASHVLFLLSTTNTSMLYMYWGAKCVVLFCFHFLRRGR